MVPLVSFSVTEASSLARPTSIVVFSLSKIGGVDCGPRLGACRHEAKNDSTHCGRRKQKSTAEATIRDIPSRAIVNGVGFAPRDAGAECKRVLLRHLVSE